MAATPTSSHHVTNPLPNCVIRIPAVDTYSTQGKSIMGRQSANEGFLRAWFQYAGQQEYICLTRFKSEAQVFADLGTRVFAQQGIEKKPFRWFAQAHIHHVASIGTAFLPGPQVADMAWIRRRNPHCLDTDFSLVGMTHTTCELTIQAYLADMLIAPVYEWDAQICPSVSVKTMVAQLLDDEAAWLRERFGASQMILPQLPVLPLGIHCRDFDLPEAEKQKWRMHWRAQWQLTDEQVCVLYMGRLDLRSKANLFPMFDALELASKQLMAQGKPALTLVLAGWFAGEWNENAIKQGVTTACPSVRVIFEDGRTEAVRQGVWHGADVFSSLVDNIQETFGLTPIEAMAAGLPVVVTDYDGYKESVRDGVDGYRIRTCQPAAGYGTELVDRHADLMDNYHQYASRASWMIGLDIHQAAAAYVQLASSQELRHRMGQSARLRAQAYDWAGLIPQYQQLFADLAVMRQNPHASQATPWQSQGARGWGLRHPRKSDPFYSFANYPTQALNAQTAVQLHPYFAQHPLADVIAHVKAHLTRPVYELHVGLLEESMVLGVVQYLHTRPNSAESTLAGAVAQSLGLAQWQIIGVLGWLTKTGVRPKVS